MAKKFQELVKKIDIVRKYTRDFYIYGFKERDDFSGSQRGYDNERRRIESYLAEWVVAEVVQGKKRVRLELDSNQNERNPLVQVWGAKSFTKNDIFLHFVLLDILGAGERWTIQEIVDTIDSDYLSQFSDDYLLDSLTIRKKVKEYTALGFFREEKEGRECLYVQEPPLEMAEDLLAAVSFFKEVFPTGVLGDYLLSREEQSLESVFQFKHVFPVQTLDSQIVLQLLEAIHLKREISFQTDRKVFEQFTPIRLCFSCESGRQYLVGRINGKKHFFSIRVNFISEVKLKEEAPLFDRYLTQFLKQKEITWNAAFTSKRKQQLKVYLKINEETEKYLIRRLEKEKRQGTVEHTGENQYLFTIELVDMIALNPFLRTFFGRIERIQCTNRVWEQQFWRDYEEMYQLYLGGEVDESALS